MWNTVASNGITFLIAGFVALAGLITWGQQRYAAPGPLEQPICLRVTPGSTMNAVSRDLVDLGAVSEGWILRVGAQYQDKSGDLKAGSFVVPEGAAMNEIVDIVTRGGASTCGTNVVYRVGLARTEVLVRELDPETGRFVERAAFRPGDDAPAEYLEAKEEADARFQIAVAEGLTSWRVVEALNGIDILAGEIEGVPDEGSLAPDSFEVRVGMDRSELIARMTELQSERLTNAWAGRAEGLPLETPREALILASIIEKETAVARERGKVASVFVNRLRVPMRLQTDPTVIYGITLGEGTLGRGLRRSELDRDTPYNTYTRDGLPPTPIANPGDDSIRAAVNPEATPFLFFVADGTGGHAFAETLSEHNANVRRWREIEAARANQ